MWRPKHDIAGPSRKSQPDANVPTRNADHSSRDISTN